MQLKVFLVVAFVTNVACLNMNEDPSSLVKILKKDPSSFVESLAGADSNTINEVINMLQVLINEGNTALQALIDRKTEAKDKLDAATTDLSNALATQTTAEKALHEATTTKSNADDAYVDAVDNQQTADSEHTTAVNNLDTEGSLLKNNNDLMEQVIGMLQTLSVQPTITSSGSGSYVVKSLHKGVVIWTDRDQYTFTDLPDEVEGGFLFSGPVRIPSGSVLSLNGGQRGRMYAFLTEGRSGTYESTLLNNGWENTGLVARWLAGNGSNLMNVYRKTTVSEILPEANGNDTVVAFGFVPSGN